MIEIEADGDGDEQKAKKRKVYQNGKRRIGPDKEGEMRIVLKMLAKI